MLLPGAHRWRLSEFTNAHRRAVLGNSDRSPPWSCPDPAGVNYVWARQEEIDSLSGETVPLSWVLFPDVNGPAPAMG
eukprot:11205478-Alexandrium_andersonii.AAC.1